MFRDRFWISLLLTVPILVWSETVQGWFNYSPPTFPVAGRIPAIFGTIVFLYGGLPFLKGGAREIRDRQPGMMLLISLAIVVAYVSSVASETGALDLEFWWELALLIDVMLLGHWQEMKALGQASGALEALAALLPDEAEIVEVEGTRTAQVQELEPGMPVLVRSGGRVPADGTIEEGTAEFDESMITGESKPVAKGVGDTVVAGTIATDNSVRVRVTAVGEDMTLAGIRRLVMEAQASKSRAQSSGRPSCGRSLLRRAGFRRSDVRGLGRLGRHGPSGRAIRDRTRDLVPARPRARDPARHRDLHVGCRQGGHPHQGSSRARADAHDRHSPLRQDGHVDPRDAGRDRRRGGRRHLRRGPSPGGGRRVR